MPTLSEGAGDDYRSALRVCAARAAGQEQKYTSRLNWDAQLEGLWRRGECCSGQTARQSTASNGSLYWQGLDAFFGFLRSQRCVLLSNAATRAAWLGLARKTVTEVGHLPVILQADCVSVTTSWREPQQMSAESHGHVEGASKKIALLISVLALFLALSETLGKSAQTQALGETIEASNLWAFFQAKSIRLAMLRASSERLEHDKQGANSGEDRTAALSDRWTAQMKRLDSEPDTLEGRKELTVRAKAAEARRDLSLARYHHYEVASASLQIAIVLASASVITSVGLLAWLGGAVGLIGVVFAGIGLWAPHSVHLM